MSPFGNGKPGERRRKDTSLPGGRRDDDPDIEVASQYGFWAKLMFAHRAKVMAALMSLSTVGGAMITAALLAPRVARLEQSVSVLQTDVQTLKQSEETKMYILCTLIRRVDRDAEPNECRRRLAGLALLQIAHLSPATLQ